MNKTIKLKNSLFILLQPLRSVSTTGNISNSIFSINIAKGQRREYVKKELVGYSMEQLYEVVSDVNNYYRFVPYVKKSHIHSKRSDDDFKADLNVGFSPLNEEYTSRVKLIRPILVTSECHDGKLFKYIKNEWSFSPGLKDIPQSCVLDFVVKFQFKSIFHSQIANLFFDYLCDQMEYAFLVEARKRFGPPSIKTLILASKRS